MRPTGDRISPYQRLIRALDRVLGELTRECHVRGVSLRDHEQTAGVFVEAVDNTRPERSADARQSLRAVRDQRVDERAVGIAGASVDDEPGGLVDDDQVFVFIDHGKRHRLRPR